MTDEQAIERIAKAIAREDAVMTTPGGKVTFRRYDDMPTAWKGI